jgi:hypothetical protein
MNRKTVLAFTFLFFSFPFYCAGGESRISEVVAHTAGAGTEGAIISWHNPTIYEDNGELPANLRATLETRLYFSLDRARWTPFALVPNGGESWSGLLPVAQGVPGYYALTSTIPGSDLTDPFDEVTATIGNFQDTFVVFGDGAGTNFSSEPVIIAHTWPAGHAATRGFLKWDLSSLPADARVLNASLRLYYVDPEGEGGDNTYMVSVAKVAGVNVDIGQATGNSPDNIVAWTGGADGGAKNLAPVETAVAVGKNRGWVVWNVTNMVQEWVEAPWTNQGMAIDPDPAASEGSNRHFASREHPDPKLHPELVITYRRYPHDSTQQELSSLPAPLPLAEQGNPADTFTVEIGKYEDTFVNLGVYSDVNYFDDPLIRTYTWKENNVANRGFIRWELSGLPTDITVKNATLWLYYVAEENGGGDNTYTVNVSSVTGVSPDLEFATWNRYDGISAWPGGQNGGAEAVSPAAASSTIGKTQRWVSWDVTGMVAEWVAGPGMDFVMVIDADTSASADSNRFFASGEYPDPGLRPQLLITYTKNR